MPRSYFYELSIRHEDMHVEALAYTRQTLGYARPARSWRCEYRWLGPLAGDVDDSRRTLAPWLHAR